jgi:hypothetical protein
MSNNNNNQNADAAKAAEEAKQAADAAKAAEEAAKNGELFEEEKKFTYKFTEDTIFRGVYRYKGDEITLPEEMEISHAKRVN